MTKLPTFEELTNLAPQEIKDVLKECEETPQNPYWHPEGNVLIHIKIVYKRALETGDLNIVLAAFFHDLGKASTTKPNKKGDWAAHGHEFVSAKLVEKHNVWITSLGGDWEQVHTLVKEHMRIKYIDDMRPIKKDNLMTNPWFDKLNKFTELDDMSNLSKEELNL